MNWNHIKAEILAETKDILQTEPNFNANEAVELFVECAFCKSIANIPVRKP